MPYIVISHIVKIQSSSNSTLTGPQLDDNDDDDDDNDEDSGWACGTDEITEAMSESIIERDCPQLKGYHYTDTLHKCTYWTHNSSKN